jgi:glycosyltransferase involved in cell wall biosynthesis
MRIAILGTRGIPSGYSGYETFAEEVGRRLVERGHDVSVYCRRGIFKERPATYLGMKMLYLPSIQTKSLSTFTHTFLSAWHLVFRRADVALFVNVANSPFCLITKLAGIKTALNVDGLEWLRPKWGPLGKRYFLTAARIAKYTSHELITDADRMREIYLEEFQADSTMIAYGANIMTSTRPELLEPLGLKKGEYFFTACRLVPDNNVDLMIEAFRRTGTTKKYAIAGGTPYENQYVARLKGMADGRIKFLGHIDDQEVIRELHCNAYAYLHGHQYGGTNPTLLKALAFGNCILALDTAFNREVLGEHGMFFEKDIADVECRLREVLEHPEIQARLARNAPDRIREKYTWDIITGQYEALCQRLLGRRKP